MPRKKRAQEITDEGVKRFNYATRISFFKKIEKIADQENSSVTETMNRLLKIGLMVSERSKEVYEDIYGVKLFLPKKDGTLEETIVI